MARQSLQYRLCTEALRDVTTDRTAVSYKRSIKQFVAWERANPPAHAQDPAERVQRWERALERAGASPSTIHTKLAPVCKGFKISMRDVKHPRRTADRITRGRRPDVNQQGRAELENSRFSDSVTLARASGLRRAELGKVASADYVRDESGYPCLRVRGKGGKLQLQRILPAHQKEVEELAKYRFDFFDESVPMLGADEMGSHVNYHSIRADVAREAYAYYAERLRTEPEYREQLRRELVARYDAYHRAGAGERQRFIESSCGVYKLRGANAEKARAAGRPVEYDRTALLAVSVFHLSHWRLDVTVTNYMV